MHSHYKKQRDRHIPWWFLEVPALRHLPMMGDVDFKPHRPICQATQSMLQKERDECQNQNLYPLDLCTNSPKFGNQHSKV